jgi:plasmid stabilization system protein ParE
MAYAVKLFQRAERDLLELFLYLDDSDSSAARRWFNGLEKAIYGVERFPGRCQIAPESQKLGRTVRQLSTAKSQMYTGSCMTSTIRRRRFWYWLFDTEHETSGIHGGNPSYHCAASDAA